MAETQAAGGSVLFLNIHGRNGYDDPFSLRADECCEALNGDFFGAALMRRRGGSIGISLTGGTTPTLGIRFMCRHVPGSDQSAAEFWTVDGTGLFKRLTGGTVWANVTVDDPITGNFGEVNAVSFNGRLFFCYQSGQNRLHVWDPVLARIRRVGIATAGVPSAANGGGGGFAVIRYYKIRFVAQSGGVTIRQGELSTAINFTPGANGVTVTRSALPGESETHWEVFGSPDNTNYFSLSVIAAATTTYLDNANPATYSGTVPPVAGSYFPPPSAKYIVADTGKMIMGGCWETSGGFVTTSNNRLWFTSQLGSSNVSDDERISITSTISSFDDIGEAVTGISPPQQGSFFAYSYTHQWKYVATPSVSSPYQRFIVSGGQGCISHKSILVATDDSGYPSTYWDSKRGLERAGRYGNQFCGVDSTDLWGTINLDATTLPFSVYHEDIHQIWNYIPVSGVNVPNLKLVFDTWLGKVIDPLREGAVRGGWTQHTGESAIAYCASMFSTSIAASMGRALKPYIGYAGSVGAATQIWRCDTEDRDDNGTAFQAYIESRPLVPWGLGKQGGVTDEPFIIAKTNSGVQIQLTVIWQEGADSKPATVSLSPVSDGLAETRVFTKFDAATLGDVACFRIRVGDPSAIAVLRWLLTAVVFPIQEQGEV